MHSLIHPSPSDPCRPVYLQEKRLHKLMQELECHHHCEDWQCRKTPCYIACPNAERIHLTHMHLCTWAAAIVVSGTFKAGCSSQTQLTVHIAISFHKVNLSVCLGSIHCPGTCTLKFTSLLPCCQKNFGVIWHHWSPNWQGIFTSIIKLILLNKIQETLYSSSSQKLLKRALN